MLKLLSLAKRTNRNMNDHQPVKLLNDESRDALTARYYQKFEASNLDYATVKDFCDSADHLPQICYLNGDLKNVQRAWTVKTILGNFPLGSKLLEVGGGVPLAAGMLAELGYEVTIVDPYEGAGNGPVEYEAYLQQFPHVNFVKDFFDSKLSGYSDQYFDGIYSISVLEHIPISGIREVYEGVHKFLKKQGLSIHCVDVVVAGDRAQEHIDLLKEVIFQQLSLANSACSRQDSDRKCDQLLLNIKDDLETFYLSPEGHNLWRNTVPYDDFPFRKVISAQTVVSYQGG